MRLENVKYSYNDRVFSVLYSITILPVVYKLDDVLPIIQMVVGDWNLLPHLQTPTPKLHNT